MTIASFLADVRAEVDECIANTPRISYDRERAMVGVHLAMPAQEYHAFQGASSSRLKAFHGLGITPAHARIKIQEPWEPTHQMVFGTMVHHWLLEPTSVPPCVSVTPEKYTDADGKRQDWNGRTKICREWKAGEVAKGRAVLTRAEWENIPTACEAILNHPIAGPLFQRGRSEVSVIAWDSTNEIPVRVRPDWKPDSACLVDAKLTTRGVSQREFENTAYKLGYHIQAALYLDLWNAATGEGVDDFKFIAVEQEPPFDVQVYRASPRMIEKGREDYRRHLATLAECLRTDQWPGSPAVEHVLELPRYVDAGA